MCKRQIRVNWTRRKIINTGLFTLGITAASGIPPAAPQLQKRTYNAFARIVSRQIYETTFPQRNPLYTYDSLVRAVEYFPKFCNEGSDEHCKREAAAFLANIAHETSGLVYLQEVNKENWPKYCDPNNTAYPCVPGRTYHGRGPIQLSWNFNYGAEGKALGLNLLNNPDLVISNGVIAFQTALWFWMTPHLPKPSCHDVMSGRWNPTPEQVSKRWAPGFGMIINIINGYIECNKPTPPQVNSRVEMYQRFTKLLGVSMGNNFYCTRMKAE